MRISTTACVLGAIWAAQSVAAQSVPADGAAAPRAAQAPRPGAERQEPQRPAAPGAPVKREGPQGTWTNSPFTRTIPIGARNTVELTHASGSVVITGVSGSSNVTINANRRILMQNREAALAMLQKVMPQITQRGGGVEILTGLPDGVKLPPILVDYEITVPNTAAVSLSSWGGEIRVSNVGGELRVDLNGAGDVALTNVKRVRKVKALGGMVTVTGMEGDELNVETISGNVNVRNATAQTLEIKSATGSVSTNNATCDRCVVNSSSGNIEIVGPLRPDARMTIKTNRGHVRLVPTGNNIRFDLEALTTGTKQSDYPLKSRATELRMLRGSYGEVEGSTIISISSFTGNITVARP